MVVGLKAPPYQRSFPEIVGQFSTYGTYITHILAYERAIGKIVTVGTTGWIDTKGHPELSA